MSTKISEKELRKKREWFEEMYTEIKKNGANFVYVRVASAAIWTTSYEFNSDDRIVFLYNEGKLAGIVYNIMDIEDVY